MTFIVLFQQSIFWTGLPNIELEKELPLSVPWYLPGSGKCKISDFELDESRILTGKISMNKKIVR